MIKIKPIVGMLLFLLLVLPASASNNRFDPNVNLNNINWFDRGLYFGAFKFQPCIDLEEFYAYADSDKYDRWDRDDADRYVKKMDYQDAKVIANKKRSDYRDNSQFRKPKDLKCSTKRSFDEKADEKRYDDWDDDDFYEYLGTKNAQQYQVRTRHYPYERSYSTTMRVDKSGGIASIYPFTRYR